MSGLQGSFDLNAYIQNGDSTTKLPISFNIIHVLNISKSSISQLDDWRECEDPNKVSMDRLSKSSRQGMPRLITEVDMSDDSSKGWGTSFVATEPGCTYRLLLRDSRGNYCYGYDYNTSLAFLRSEGNASSPLPIPLGGRLLVKSGTEVVSGVLLLKGLQCRYLGTNDQDRSLISQLNTGLIRKYITSLNESLAKQQA